jgi:predicted Zn-dependent protease
VEQLYRDYPQDASVSYLYGAYEKAMNDLPKAKFYWERALGLDPRQFPALVELGHTALDENQPAVALPYLQRAAQAKPTAWQPYVLMVTAYSKQGKYAEAAKAANRALELGRGQTEALELYLATTLAQAGSRERAILAVQDYLKNQPNDAPAQHLLEILQRPPANESAANVDVAPLLPSVWMPAGVDDLAPSVELT